MAIAFITTPVSGQDSLDKDIIFSTGGPVRDSDLSTSADSQGNIYLAEVFDGSVHTGKAARGLYKQVLNTHFISQFSHFIISDF